MGNEPAKTIPIHDIVGPGAFVEFKKPDFQLALLKQENGKVIGEAPATEEIYRLLGEYQTNPVIPLLDFLAVQRRLRGRMLDLRDGEGRNNGNGRNGRGSGAHS